MSNKRNIRVFILLAFISLVPLLLFAEDVTVTFKAGSYQITKNQKGEDVIFMEGFDLGGPAGNPMLPQRIYNIAFPPDINWATLRMRIDHIEMEQLPDYYNIVPAPAAATFDPETGERIVVWGDNKKIAAGKNTLVYSSSAFYPENNAEFLPYSQMRKWKYTRIKFSPFQYSPASGQLTLMKAMQITLSFERTGIQTEADLQLLRDCMLDEQARKILYNYQQALKWYALKRGQGRPSANNTNWKYVIITSNAIKAASTKLNAFVSHKQSLGFTVKVITETDFAGPYDIQKDIRQWLINNYSTYSIEHVLLIGNPNPTSSDIPMRMCWPRNHLTTYKETPTDYYYADLTGNWDFDGDGFYGEYNDDYLPSGGVDLAYELYVGRIPVYASAVGPLDSILEKMIAYEQSLGSSALSFNYRKKILLPMKPSDGSTPGYQLGEQIKDDFSAPYGDHYYRIYDSDYGLVPPPEKTPCTKTNVVNEWKKGYGMVCWWTHGNATSAANVFDTTLVSQLDNNQPCFTFQASCLNSHPETSNNLAYELLKHGAVNTISGTRVTWYAGGWSAPTTAYGDNASLAYYYVEFLRTWYTFSGWLYFIKKSIGLGWGGTSLMNMYDYNIYGDPAMRLWYQSQGDVAAGQGPGAASYVKDFSSQTGSLLKTFKAFGAANANGEVSVAKGNVTGDGRPEIVIGQRSTGASSYVRVFKEDGTLLWGFQAFGAGNTNGMVNVAVGDVDKDGYGEIIVGQGPGGQSYVRIFGYGNSTPVTAWKAFGAGNVSGEVRVAAGDTGGFAGYGQIITGVGHGGNSYVRVWDYGIPPTLYKTIKAFGASNTSGGVDVAVGNFNNNKYDTNLIAVGQGGPGATAAAAAGSYYRIYAESGTLLKTVKAFGAVNTKGRVTVGTVQGDYDLADEILVGQAVGGASYWRIFNYDGTLVRTVQAFGGSNTNGQVDVDGEHK